MSGRSPTIGATASELRERLERRLLDAGERVWARLPRAVCDTRALRRCGGWAHISVRRRADREMYLGTQFLRNRPALELMRRLAERGERSGPLRVAVLGCSIGAEVYSIVWALRRDRPALELSVHALDISPEVIVHARTGSYSPEHAALVHAEIFAGLSEDERDAMFDWDGATGSVKTWLRDGIDWLVADACDPELAGRLGPQDLVVASNFLCHMPPEAARRCLRNIARLVAPGGHLFVSGVDLDIRTEVAREQRWEPVAELREQIHDGDRLVRADWPWRWWGLEPLDRRRADWETRYSAVFRTS